MTAAVQFAVVFGAITVGFVATRFIPLTKRPPVREQRVSWRAIGQEALSWLLYPVVLLVTLAIGRPGGDEEDTILLALVGPFAQAWLFHSAALRLAPRWPRPLSLMLWLSVTGFTGLYAVGWVVLAVRSSRGEHAWSWYETTALWRSLVWVFWGTFIWRHLRRDQTPQTASGPASINPTHSAP